VPEKYMQVFSEDNCYFPEKSIRGCQQLVVPRVETMKLISIYFIDIMRGLYAYITQNNDQWHFIFFNMQENRKPQSNIEYRSLRVVTENLECSTFPLALKRCKT
jgi:hypothetical protein